VARAPPRDRVGRAGGRRGALSPVEQPVLVSDQLERWLRSPGPKTLGSLISLFGEKSFALVFVLLLAVPALPLPTGGATHVFEVIAMLVALQLIVGRRQFWLPARWCRREIAGESGGRLVNGLLRLIRWFERFSRPRFGVLLRPRLSRSLFGALVLAFSVTAFVAPPFSGLDTLPALGVVVLSLGILLEDAVLAGVGVVIGALGMVLVIGLGSLVVRWISHL